LAETTVTILVIKALTARSRSTSPLTSQPPSLLHTLSLPLSLAFSLDLLLPLFQFNSGSRLLSRTRELREPEREREPSLYGGGGRGGGGAENKSE